MHTQAQHALTFDKPLGQHQLLYKFLARRMMCTFLKATAGIMHKQRATNVYKRYAKQMRSDGGTSEEEKEYTRGIPGRVAAALKGHQELLDQINAGDYDADLALSFGFWEKPPKQEGKKPKPDLVMATLASNWTSTHTTQVADTRMRLYRFARYTQLHNQTVDLR
jgi:hypothetical protein